MKELLSTQYELVKSSRHALFAYCATMDDEDLYKQIPEFNNNSIRDMLVHNINTYISWIDNFGLDGSRTFIRMQISIVWMKSNNYLSRQT